MPDTTTPALSLVKPEPGASENTWGDKLNANFDLIDSFALTAVRTTGVQTVTGNEFRLRGTSGAQATPGLNFATGVGMGWNSGVGLALISGGQRRLIVDDTNQRVTVTAGYAFGGSGAGLTNLPAGSLTGTIDDARIPSGIVRTSRTLTGGDGINTIGDLSANRTVSVDSSVVRTSRTLTAGSGLTGGGDLSANRTLTLGTPSSIGDTTSNAVTGSSHTHEIGPTIARSATQISAGNGLSGGGSLAADRTLSMGTPSSITGSSTNSTSSTSHTHNLDLGGLPLNTGSSDPNPRLLFISGDNSNSLARIGELSLKDMFNLVPLSRSINAGNGMTGGGSLAADRTLTLGTPSSITSSSTNSVTGTSHTHAISSATIRVLVADSEFGQVGTYAFLRNEGDPTGNNGLRPGSVLYPADHTGASEGAPVTGTWRCMGTCGNGRASNWLRVS